MNREDFIRLILPGAKEGYKQYNILPSLILAQAILESATGQRHIENNLFGIKAGKSWTGKIAERLTTEYINGKPKKVTANFRAYDSFADSVMDHSRLLGESSRYMKVKQCSNYRDACFEIWKAGYATDPKYPEKLIKIIELFNLNQYDTKEAKVMHKHYKVALTDVVEVDPLALSISVQDKMGNSIPLQNFVTGGYQLLQGNGKTAPLGILVSEGKIISNRQPHNLPAGTLIVYKDGSVDVKPVLDITKEKNVRFAVSGCSILPSIRMKEEGFKGVFADIGRTCDRPVIGYNPQKNKIIIAVRPLSNIARGQQTLKNLGCTKGITLDAGGSTILKVNNKIIKSTARQLHSVITW